MSNLRSVIICACCCVLLLCSCQPISDNSPNSDNGDATAEAQSSTTEATTEAQSSTTEATTSDLWGEESKAEDTSNTVITLPRDTF